MKGGARLFLLHADCRFSFADCRFSFAAATTHNSTITLASPLNMNKQTKPQPMLNEIKAERSERAQLGSSMPYQRTLP